MLPSPTRPHGTHWLVAYCPPPWAAAPLFTPLVSLPVCGGRVCELSRVRSLSGLGGSVCLDVSRLLVTPPRANHVLWGLSRPSFSSLPLDLQMQLVVSRAS